MEKPTIFKSIVGFLKTHYLISAVVILAVITGAVVYGKSGNGLTEIKVEQGMIIQTVQATGKTKAANDVALGFERTGKVALVNVKVGDIVKAGDVLVALDQSESKAKLLKAEATLAANSANLSEDIEIYGTKIADADITLADAKNNLVASMKNAYVKSDDAVRNYADQFFTNLDTSSPNWKESLIVSNLTILLNVDDISLKIRLVDERRQIQTTIKEWQSLVPLINTSDPDISTKVTKTKSYLSFFSVFLSDLALAVNRMPSPSQTYDATFAGFRADVGTARANVETAISNLNTAEEKYNSALSNLAVLKKELELKTTSGSSSASAAEAKILESKAEVASSLAELAKGLIKAPFSGIVTSVDVDPGEIVGSGSVVRLISRGNFDIESNISEVNIGKIRVGNPVRVTFDGLPGQEFLGQVSYIDPGETLIDNVVNYKVTVVLTTPDEAIRSGMTANLNIEANKKENVLILPAYAISKENGESFVEKVGPNGTERVKVLTGILGSDGKIEIISGISLGDVVVIKK